MKRNILIILVVGGLLALAAAPGHPEESGYPNRQIEFIIPYEPGGSIDMMSRIFIEAIKDSLKVPVVPVNKPGAGGSIGLTYVANAKPDGYTLGFSSIGALVVTPVFEPRLPYKRSDLTMICKTISILHGLFVKADAPWQNLQELVDYARANPGKLRAAVGGPTGAPALMLEAFKMQAGGLNIISIPSKGGHSMATAILGGQVEICADPVASEVNLLRAGRVRALAVSNKIPGFPQIPTFKEAGFAGVDLTGWGAAIAPRGLPKPIQDKVTAAFSSAVKNPATIQLLRRESMEVDFASGEAFHRQLEREDKMVMEIAKKIGSVKKGEKR